MNIADWIKENLLTKQTKAWYHILKKNEEKLSLIYDASSIFPNDYDKINARIYWILHRCDIYCPVCGKIKNFINFEKGFGSACSKQCAHKIANEKYKQTCLEKYGVDNPMKLSSTKNKAKQTCLKKYGVENVAQVDEIREKTKRTNNERYGVDSPLQNEKIFEKYKQTCLERFNVDNAAKTEQNKQKYKQTCLEKYGVDNVNKLEQTKKKIKQTLFDRYGENFYIENRKKSLKYIKNKNYETFCLNLSRKHLSLLSTRDEFINSTEYKFKCLTCRKRVWVLRHKLSGCYMLMSKI